jgi:hypothetical protein
MSSVYELFVVNTDTTCSGYNTVIQEVTITDCVQTILISISNGSTAIGPFNIYSGNTGTTALFSGVTRNQLISGVTVTLTNPDACVSPTPVPTNSVTPTITPTNTPTITQTITPTITPTVTPTITQTITPTITPTNSVTPTLTQTITPTITPTKAITFDVDYQAVLNYASTISGVTLPSDGQKIIQNQLILDLKAGDNVWSKLDTFALFATDGNSDFASIDWIRLTAYTVYNPTFVTNQGFMGNGSSSYIDTNFNLLNDGQNYKDNDASRYYYHFSGNSGIIDGIESSVAYNRMQIANTTNQTINSVGALTGGTFAYTILKGVKSIHRTSNNDVILYNNTTGVTRTQTYETPLRSVNQLILRRTGAYSTNTVSMYAMGASLSVSDNTQFVNAINNYMDSIST